MQKDKEIFTGTSGGSVEILDDDLDEFERRLNRLGR